MKPVCSSRSFHRSWQRRISCWRWPFRHICGWRTRRRLDRETSTVWTKQSNPQKNNNFLRFGFVLKLRFVVFFQFQKSRKYGKLCKTCFVVLKMAFFQVFSPGHIRRTVPVEAVAMAEDAAKICRLLGDRTGEARAFKACAEAPKCLRSLTTR